MSGIIGAVRSKSGIINRQIEDKEFRLGIGDSNPNSVVVINKNFNDAHQVQLINENGGSSSSAYLKLKSNVQQANIFVTSSNNTMGGGASRLTIRVGINGVYMGANDTSWSAVSDERLKKDWVNFEDAVDKINSLTKLGTFIFCDPKTKEEQSGERVVGFSAQEVQKVLPEAVAEGGKYSDDSEDDTTYLGVQKDSVFCLALKAIQELSTENTELKTKLDALEARVTALEG